MRLELPDNVIAAFGESPDSFRACLWLLSMEEEIFDMFGKHQVDLTVVQLREIFGVVVH